MKRYISVIKHIISSSKGIISTLEKNILKIHINDYFLTQSLFLLLLTMILLIKENVLKIEIIGFHYVLSFDKLLFEL
jgi:hypothetical protein